MNTGLLLLAHGSPDRRHSDVVYTLTRRLADQLTGPVACGFLDHDEPGVVTALETLARSTDRVVSVSLLFADGFHSAVDVPAALAKAPPRLAISHAGSLGLGTWLIPVLQQRLQQAVGVADAAAATVVLCAAGSSRAAARGQVASLADQWSRRRQAVVLPAFATGTGPALDDAIGDALQRAPAVIVLPLLLAEGRLSEQIRAQAGARGVAVAQTLGPDPTVVQRVVELFHSTTVSVVSLTP